MNIPVIASEHIRDARLYADRKDLILALCTSGKVDVIGEVGVALGEFSEFLLKSLAPKLFIGFDLFDLHHQNELWGQDTKAIFKGKTHYDFYRERLSSYGKAVMAEKGPSQEMLARFPDGSFNLIYLDADHGYDGVKQDAELASKKLAADGLLIFNDYIMYDHIMHSPYGVVPVVNDMVVNEGWDVVGFSLQQQLFCDIALRRSRTRPRAT
jgi:hypothetical protein